MRRCYCIQARSARPANVAFSVCRSCVGGLVRLSGAVRSSQCRLRLLIQGIAVIARWPIKFSGLASWPTWCRNRAAKAAARRKATCPARCTPLPSDHYVVCVGRSTTSIISLASGSWPATSAGWIRRSGWYDRLSAAKIARCRSVAVRPRKIDATDTPSGARSEMRVPGARATGRLRFGSSGYRGGEPVPVPYVYAICVFRRGRSVLAQSYVIGHARRLPPYLRCRPGRAEQSRSGDGLKTDTGGDQTKGCSIVADVIGVCIRGLGAVDRFGSIRRCGMFSGF
jgi:hypothetical protein